MGNHGAAGGISERRLFELITNNDNNNQQQYPMLLKVQSQSVYLVLR